MAYSRTEKIGTIFSRITALHQTKSMPDENIPLWYDIYKAFPPKYEPRFDRRAPDTELRKIFYEEDRIRAKFQKQKLPAMNLKSNEVSLTQVFLELCKSLQMVGVQEEKIYNTAMRMYKANYGDTRTLQKQTKIGKSRET